MNPLRLALWLCLVAAPSRLVAQVRAEPAGAPQQFEETLKTESASILRSDRIKTLREQMVSARGRDPDDSHSAAWDHNEEILKSMEIVASEFADAKNQIQDHPAKDPDSARAIQEKLDELKKSLSGLCAKAGISDVEEIRARYRAALGAAGPPSPTPDQAQRLSAQSGRAAERLGADIAAVGGRIAGIQGAGDEGASGKLDDLYHGAARGGAGGVGGPDTSVKPAGAGALATPSTTQGFGAATTVRAGVVPELGDASKYPDDKPLRGPIIKEMEKNPVTKELVLPVLKDGTIKIAVRGNKDRLEGDWAVFNPAENEIVLNRDEINSDLKAYNKTAKTRVAALEPGRTVSEEQAQFIASRYKPTIAHELTHAVNDQDLAGRLGRGHEAPNVKDTERQAFEVQAMTIAAERRSNPGYLKDGTPYGLDSQDLADVYESSQKRGDRRRSFDSFVDGLGYRGVTVADKSPQELERLGGFSDKVKADCTAHYWSDRCQHGLQTIQGVLSPSGQKDLQESRRKLMSSADCAGDQKAACTSRVLGWTDISKIKLGESPRTMAAVGAYYREQDEKLEKVDARVLGAPPETETATAAARTAAASKILASGDGISVSGSEDPP